MVTLPSSLSSSKRAERRAAVDALVLVDLGASLTLAVVHADVDIGAGTVALTLTPRSVAARNQSEAFREERPDHAIAIDRFLEGEPGHLVQAEHDRDAVSRLHIERCVFESQREVSD